MHHESTTATCAVGIRHDRCLGVVRSLLGDHECGCICHHPVPYPEEELESAAEAAAELVLERSLEAEHFGDVA
jgi:hypothetical protein